MISKQVKYNNSLKGFITNRWHGMKRRTQDEPCYVKKSIKLNMTREQFTSWVKSHWPLIQDLKDQGKTPSIDRIDSSQHYTISNIQIISLRQNCIKGAQEAARVLTKKFPTRFCVICEKPIDRKQYSCGRLESWAKYNKKVSCSRRCQIHLRKRNKQGRFI